VPDLWCDVDVGVIVPVNILPLLDDTDFKTIETAIVYDSAGMDLVWNFMPCAGPAAGTAVTPTTAGNYDWTEHVSNKGMYSIEIPASGGVSINNDTEGVGWFTGKATGVLAWRGPTIGFRRAALNDLLIEGGTASTNLEDMFDGTGYAGGTAKLTVDVAKWLGTAADTPTTAGVPNVNMKAINDVATTPVTTVKAVQGLTTADTIATLTGHTPQTGDSYAVVNSGTFGNSALKTLIDAIDTIVDAITAKTANLPTDPADQSLIIAATDAIIAAIADKTGYRLSATGVNDILRTALTEGYAADGVTFTVEQALYMLWAALAEFAISSTTLTANKLDGATPAMTFTLDDATNPTSRTRAT